MIKTSPLLASGSFACGLVTHGFCSSGRRLFRKAGPPPICVHANDAPVVSENDHAGYSMESLYKLACGMRL
jgi:hypothetical protein